MNLRRFLSASDKIQSDAVKDLNAFAKGRNGICCGNSRQLVPVSDLEAGLESLKKIIQKKVSFHRNVVKREGDDAVSTLREALRVSKEALVLNRQVRRVWLQSADPSSLLPFHKGLLVTSKLLLEAKL